MSENKELQEVDLTKVKCGYIVALQDDGELIFETMGAGIVEMLGLHQYAGIKIQRPFNDMSLERINQTLQVMSKLIAQGFLSQKPSTPEPSDKQ
jgi:hypothetical protein